METSANNSGCDFGMCMVWGCHLGLMVQTVGVSTTVLDSHKVWAVGDIWASTTQ